MKSHPIAACYPPLPPEEFAQLKEHIRLHGQQNPIVLYEGMILDGTQRYRACEELGIPPKTIAPQITDPIAYVVGQNERRRHLTKLQKIEVAARLAGLKWGTNRYAQKVETSREVSTFTLKETANLMGVSDAQVSRFRKVFNSGVPELMEAVKEKRINLDVASKIAKASPEQQRLELSKPLNLLRDTFSPHGEPREQSSRKKKDKVINPRRAELLAEINAPSKFPVGLPLPVHPTRPDRTKIIQEAILLLQQNESLIAKLPSYRQLNNKIWVFTQCIQTYELDMDNRATGPIDRQWVRWAHAVADKYRCREEMLNLKTRWSTIRDTEPKKRAIEKGYPGRIKRLAPEYRHILRKLGFSLADETQLMLDIKELTRSYFKPFRGPQDRNGSVPTSPPNGA